MIRKEISLNEKELEKIYLHSLHSKDNISYWRSKLSFEIPNIEKNNILLPNLFGFVFDFDVYKLLLQDVLTSNDKKKLNDYIIEKLQHVYDRLHKEKTYATNMILKDIYNKAFIKNGTFSGKYDFNNNCYINNLNIDNIIQNINNKKYQKIIKKLVIKIRNIYYNNYIYNINNISPEFYIEKFIESNYNRPSICNGWKLNTEYRVLYDFEKCKVVKIYLLNTYLLNDIIENKLSSKDKKIFESVYPEIEEEYNNTKDDLIEKCEKIFDEKVKNNKIFTKQWYIDFMYVGKNYNDKNIFALIDMHRNYRK